MNLQKILFYTELILLTIIVILSIIGKRYNNQTIYLSVSIMSFFCIVLFISGKYFK